MPKVFYAVAVGRKNGLYDSWEQVEPLVVGHPGAKYRKFNFLQEAKQYLQEHDKYSNKDFFEEECDDLPPAIIDEDDVSAAQGSANDEEMYSYRSKIRTEKIGIKSNNGSGKKNQKSSKTKMAAADQSKPQWYYAVAVGRKPGIYINFEEADSQIANFDGAVYKRFANKNEAEEFLRNHSSQNAVAVGKKPGVYLDFKKAQEQIQNFDNPIYRKFKQRSDAENFVLQNNKC
ncbi:hypothetical protein O9G_004612 [Rozella allomycis CSF55]|uniref:Ribonuclease H n=1 Tax=Rozella allomycis (strain CSF55) TaxID=988480 RepID=A0A075AW46_ROZAC|nr:hypothetical protein O9G_004612 [Rozella allomycis CSF55]|eukprot:EPZ32932.1 hypothetical protein O9G_004612 [Rozella allomycis CSF55]